MFGSYKKANFTHSILTYSLHSYPKPKPISFYLLAVCDCENIVGNSTALEALCGAFNFCLLKRYCYKYCFCILKMYAGRVLPRVCSKKHSIFCVIVALSQHWNMVFKFALGFKYFNTVLSSRTLLHFKDAVPTSGTCIIRTLKTRNFFYYSEK